METPPWSTSGQVNHMIFAAEMATVPQTPATSARCSLPVWIGPTIVGHKSRPDRIGCIERYNSWLSGLVDVKLSLCFTYIGIHLENIHIFFHVLIIIYLLYPAYPCQISHTTHDDHNTKKHIWTGIFPQPQEQNEVPRSLEPGVKATNSAEAKICFINFPPAAPWIH